MCFSVLIREFEHRVVNCSISHRTRFQIDYNPGRAASSGDEPMSIDCQDAAADDTTQTNDHKKACHSRSLSKCVHVTNLIADKNMKQN